MSEAIVIWVAGVGALMIAILWIGAKTAMSQPSSTATDPYAPTADELRKMTPEEGDDRRRRERRASASSTAASASRSAAPRPRSAPSARSRCASSIAALAGVAFIVAFIALPWKWHLPGTPQNFRFYTPALGGLLAVLLLFMGIGWCCGPSG